MTYIVFFSRATLLVVFAAAVIGKVQSRSAWAAFVTATGTLLGVRRTRPAWAIGTVLIEGTVVVCLAVNDTAYVGLLLALLALTAFLLVVLSGVIRSVRTSCSCFGSDGTTLGWTHVWRNILLTCVAAVGTACATASSIPSVLVSASYATPVVISLIAASFFVMWDDITFLVTGRTAAE